jgi:hypothetical protein
VWACIAIPKYAQVERVLRKYSKQSTHPEVVEKLEEFLISMKNGEFDYELGRSSTDTSGLTCPQVQIFSEKLQFGSSPLEESIKKQEKRSLKFTNSMAAQVRNTSSIFILSFLFSNVTVAGRGC